MVKIGFEDPLYGYRGIVRRFLENAGVKIGDRVKIVKKDSIVEGILMPRPSLSEKPFIVVKLDNGYNIGVKFEESMKIIKVGEERPPKPYHPEIVVKKNPKLPNVAIISTGGTVALAARSALEYGAKEVYAACTHALLVENAYSKVKRAGVKEVIATNTIPSQVSKVDVSPGIKETLNNVLRFV